MGRREPRRRARPTQSPITCGVAAVVDGIEQIDRAYTSPFRYYGDGPPPLPLDRLGPDAQARFHGHTMPVDGTCAEVFARLGIPPSPAR